MGKLATKPPSRRISWSRWGCGSPITSRFEVKSVTDLVPYFSLVIGGLSLTEGEEIAEDALTTLPKAEGGDGDLAYGMTPALPEGLSFDAATRIISGTPAEAGEFEMTYTATDEDGDEASFDFTITVQPGARTARSTNPTPITLSVSPDSFPENALSFVTTLTAERNTDVGRSNISFSLAGSATEGTHYTVSPSTLPVLQIGSGFQTASMDLTFTGIPANVDENKTITISGTAPGGTVTGADITIKHAVEKPDRPTVTRTKSSAQTDPALDVKWTAPTTAGDALTGYKAQYRKSGVAAWTAYTGALSATTTSLNLAGLEAGATYEVQVRAVRGTVDGPWSDIGSGQANRAPIRTLTGPTEGQQFDAPWGWTDDVRPINSYFIDPDGDTLTFVAEARTTGDVGIIRPTIEDNKLRIHFLNPVKATITFGARDGYGGYVEDWLTINPSTNLNLDIPENSPAGTAVGDPVTGTPYIGGTLTYTLTGVATGAFEIDSSTGQISVKEGASLDYETKSSYSGQVTWTVQGKTATAYVTINVTDVAPGKPGTPTVTRTEFSRQSKPALDVTWTAADANGLTITGYEAQYRKQAAEGEDPADWTAYTGTLAATATSLRLPDLEADATYEVQVRPLTSIEEIGLWSDTGSSQANRPPKLTALGTLNPAYNLPWGGDDSVQTISGDFSDDDGDTLTYKASSAHPGALTAGIEGDDADQLRIHILNPATSTVTYGAHDGYGGYVSQDIAVSGFARPTTRRVVERSAAGTAVGDPITGTPYNGGTLTYTLTGGAGDSFKIDSTTGQISVKRGATLHYATTSSYTGRVNWTVQGLEAYVDFTINVLPLNVTRSVGENYPAGTTVGAPVTWGPNSGGTHTLSGKASTSGAFVIDSDTGQIRVGINANLDHETKSSYTGEVSYKGGDREGKIGVTINVTNAVPGKPDAPTFTRTKFSEPTPPALDVAWKMAVAYGTTITGYEARYRKQGETEWTTYSGTLDADARSLNLAGLEPGTSYEAQVRAMSGAAGAGPWSETGRGRANLPPGGPLLGDKHTPPWPSWTLEWGHSDSYARIPGHFADQDGDKLTYSAGSDDPCTLRAWMQGTALVVYMNNPVGTATRIFAKAHDAYGGVSHEAWSFYHGYSRQVREIPENSPAGTAVGDPLVGNSCNGETLTHRLIGGTDTITDNFVIDSATGQVRVKEGATLDYESGTTSWVGGVTWIVSWGRTASALLTINVTDVEPGGIGSPTLTRTPFSEPSPPALDVTWTAPEENEATVTGYEAQYRKKGETAWTPYTGTLDATNRTLTLLNLEGGATYEVQVRAVYSDESVGPWSDTGSGQANRPPTATSASFLGGTFPVGTIADYNETGTGALGVFFTDADSDALTYLASAEHPALLGVSLSGDPGEAQLKVTLLNPGTSKVTYTAGDPYGGQVTRTVTLTGTPKTVSRSVAENSAAGTPVGDPVTGMPYVDETLTYTLTDGTSGDATSAFVIDSSGGQISVKQGATLDHETKSSYIGQVEYTVNGNDAVINVTIDVTDVTAPGQPDAPTVTQSTTAPTTNLNVAWTAPTDNDGGSITDYDVQYREKGDEAWIDHDFTGTQTSTTLTGLTQNTTYEVQVRARNAEDAGEWSDSGEGSTASPNRPVVTPPTTPPTPPPAPTVAISLPTTFKNLQAMNVTFRFSADMTGFDASDVTVGNGTLGSLSGSGRVYTSTVTPNGDGNVTVTVAADTAVASGVSGPPTATSKVSTYLWIRLEGPTGPRLSWDSFEVVATFSEPPGDAMEFKHWNVEDDVPVSIEGTTATFTFTPEYYKYRWGTWPYRSRLWVNWRGLSAYFEVYSDADRPRVHRISGTTTTQTVPFSIRIQLTEDAVGFAAEDLTVVNGNVADFRQLGAWDYDADITPTRSGRLTVDIAADVFQDLIGWENTAAKQYSVNIDLSPPPPDAPTVTQSATSPTTTLDVTWTAPDIAEDGLPITDYDVQYRESGEEDWTDHDVTGTQTSTTLVGLTKDSTYEVRVRAHNSDSARPWSSPGEGKTRARAHRVEFPDQASERAVAENSPAGTSVGDVITATHSGGLSLTYTLKARSSVFALDANTGQITLAQGAFLDHEAQDTYTVVVEASTGPQVIDVPAPISSRLRKNRFCVVEAAGWVTGCRVIARFQSDLVSDRTISRGICGAWRPCQAILGALRPRTAHID